jgi:hypothetical protein
VGDEAYRKCTGRELQNQRLIRSLEIEGVGLILSSIIDYKGQRIIGQSVIPGIFAQVRVHVQCKYVEVMRKLMSLLCVQTG